MDSLKKLINKYGEPDALIDHWNKNAKKMAIWGFEEIFYYKNGNCYLNNKKINGDPLVLCNDILKSWQTEKELLAHAIGYISYDFKNDLFKHLKLKKNNNQTLLWFGKPRIIREYNINPKEHYNDEILKQLLMLKEIPTVKKYKHAIKKIKKYLKSGDTYQINYSNPREYYYEGSIFKLYMHLRNIAKPTNGFYLNIDKEQILSFSPEKFFEINNNIINTYPIKGTIERSNNIAKDQKLYEKLKNSTKDKAEHLMIVDLLRNDLGKICNYGTVKTRNLYKIKSFETIHHMESVVEGHLKKDIDFKDIIKAMFPGGSITGAPKERSIEIIDEIENYNRNIYTGTIGYLNKNYMNFNIAIRTLSFKLNKGIYPIGGGIVWDSTPEGERNEALNKGKIMEPCLSKPQMVSIDE